MKGSTLHIVKVNTEHLGLGRCGAPTPLLKVRAGGPYQTVTELTPPDPMPYRRRQLFRPFRADGPSVRSPGIPLANVRLQQPRTTLPATVAAQHAARNQASRASGRDREAASRAAAGRTLSRRRRSGETFPAAADGGAEDRLSGHGRRVR